MDEILLVQNTILLVQLFTHAEVCACIAAIPESNVSIQFTTRHDASLAFYMLYIYAEM